MNKTESQLPRIKKLSGFKRKSVSVSQENLIATELLQQDSQLPLLVQPNIDRLNLITWAKSNREFIDTHLLKHGGILFRPSNLGSIDDFEEFTRIVVGDALLDYVYGSTPRTRVSGKVYTTTEYPANETIPLHNEMAYTRTWPLRACFFCVKAAEEGGETPIADSRKIFERIDAEIRERFMEKKVLYVRNYGGGLDLPWQNVFQTSDKSEVEQICRNAGIEYEWKDGDGLRTRQVCQAVAKHPATGEMVWFNQAHLFHISNLRPEVRDRFLAEFKQEDLPRNTYYGDGTPIETSVLDEVRRVMQEETITFPWQEGDLLLLDNMLAAHARNPFVGQRRILVAMGIAVQSEDF